MKNLIYIENAFANDLAYIGKTVRFSLLFFLAAAALSAQTANFRGIVVNAENGQPLSGVHVRVTALPSLIPPYGAITDQNGRFAIDGVAAGTFEVTAELAGFARIPGVNVIGKRTAQWITITAGFPVDEIKIEMAPRALIRGRVTDDHGDPAGSITLEVRDETGEIPQDLIGAVPNAVVVNGLGEYQVSVPPGRYLVAAVWNRFPVRSGGVRGPTFEDTYHPSARRPDRASVVEVRAGQVRDGIDIHLLTPGKMNLTGKLTGYPGDGCRATVVIEKSIGSRWLDPMGTDARPDLQFSFLNIDTGVYRIRGACGPKYASVPEQLDLTQGGFAQVTVELKAQPEWTGTVEGPALRRGAWRVLEFLVTDEDWVHPAREILIDAEGKFQVSGLGPRSYLIVLGNSSEEYVESVEVDGKPVSMPIDLARVSPKTMKVVVARGGRVFGQILRPDGRPADGSFGVFVVADPRNVRRADMKSTSTSYSIEALHPGRYRIFAANGTNGITTFADWSVAAQAASEIEITAGGNVKKDLTALPGIERSSAAQPKSTPRIAAPPPPNHPDVTALLQRLGTGAISGRVLAASGKGLDSMLVQTRVPGGRAEYAVSDETGWYRLANLPRGQYAVYATPRWSYLLSTLNAAEVRSDGTKEMQVLRTGRTATVAAGEETKAVDIRTRSVPVLRITGKAARGPDKDQRVSIQLLNENGDLVGEGIRKPDDSFEFWRIQPGRYKLQGLRSNCLTGKTSTPVFELRDTPVDGVEVPTPPEPDPGELCASANVP